MEESTQESEREGSCPPFGASELLLDDLLAVVEAALLANAVSKIVFAAVGALSHAGSIKLPNAGTALISASLRSFSLWYCHGCNLL